MRCLLNFLVFLLPLVLPAYLIRFNIGPLPTTALEIFILAFIAVWIAVHRGQISGTLRATSLRPWLLPIGAWLIATLIAVFVAHDHWGAFGYWRAFMFEPVLAFLVLMDIGRRDVTETDKRDVACNVPTILLFGIATVTILMGVYAIIQYFTGWGIPSPWNVWIGRRSTGTFGYPNGLSLFIAPFGIVCFMEWIKRVFAGDKQSTRLLFLGGAAAAAASVLLAKSMGGIIALGIGVALTFILQKQTRKIGIGLGLIGLIGAACAAFYIYGTQLHPLNIETTLATQKKWSSMVRTVIWRESWQVIKAHPLLGTGLRSYQTAVAPYHTATWMEIFPHPHNIILMLWIETGILGLLSFIWICATWFMVIRRQTAPQLRSGQTDGRRLLWLVPLVVILAQGMVDMPYFKNDLAVQFWILAALASYANNKD